MSFIIPKVIGHRGAKAYAPENTLTSFHTAADMGIEWVEFDVKLSKDGEPIVFHDDTLLRTTGTEGKVADLTWQELQELDAGSWFSTSFAGTSIPHLEQVLETLINRGMQGCNIEIKACEGREEETTEVALDWATRIWPDDQQPPLISSFSQVSLEAALHMAPAWPRGLLLDNGNADNMPEDWLKLAEHLDVSTINPDGNFVTPEELQAYMATELPVLCYTINEPNRALELFELGVKAVFSDNPDLIIEEIETFH